MYGNGPSIIKPPFIFGKRNDKIEKEEKKKEVKRRKKKKKRKSEKKKKKKKKKTYCDRITIVNINHIARVPRSFRLFHRGNGSRWENSGRGGAIDSVFFRECTGKDSN